MRVLLCLAEAPGEVVSVDDLLDRAWNGVVVSPDSVYQAITALRRHLGDDPRRSTYIGTVPRLGYRMVASVGVWSDDPVVEPDAVPGGTTPRASPPAADPPRASGRRRYVAGGILAVLLLVGVAAYPIRQWSRVRPQDAGPRERSVAVLPLLDLTTQEMNEEYFADGLTEDLIGELSRHAELRVPAPTASFFFKGKQLPVADIARKLGVDFLVDGSVRKDGNVYLVSVRLLRADNGYVVLTESYERPLGDLLYVQRTIAAQAAGVIRLALERATP